MVWQTDCPIWGEGHRATIYGEAVGARGYKFIADESRVDSPRTDGVYKLTEEAYKFLHFLPNDAKARLTTWLIDKRREGEKIPVVTSHVVHSIRITDNKHDLSVVKRAERLLRLLVGQTKFAGDIILFDDVCYKKALAWSESLQADEIFYLLEYLSRQELIHFSKKPTQNTAVVSVEGYAFLEKIIVNLDSSQAFVAMWFVDKMNDAYVKGIEPAIKDTGYNPVRIDRKLDANKVDDEIFAEIRRSRFLVADMTQGDDGARGGVYFEAGLASGLELPVLYTCFHEKKNLLSFATRQFYHILWETPEDLHKQLVMRILARVGQGPLLPSIM